MPVLAYDNLLVSSNNNMHMYARLTYKDSHICVFKKKEKKKNEEKKRNIIISRIFNDDIEIKYNEF